MRLPTYSDSELDELSEDFPEDFFKMKILPELLKSVEFGGGGPKVFAFIMKLGSKLSEDEYDSRITPVIVRLFASPDRQMRVTLLDHLPSMIDHLSQKIVTDKIFPQMVCLRATPGHALNSANRIRSPVSQTWHLLYGNRLSKQC